MSRASATCDLSACRSELTVDSTRIVLLAAPRGYQPLNWCIVLFLAFGLPISGSAQESAVGPVMKLYQSGKLPVERRPAVVEMICNRGNEHDLKVVFEQVVQPMAMTKELRLKALVWLADAAKTRKVKPAGDLGRLAELFTAPDPALQRAALKLAATWQVAAVVEPLKKIAISEKSSDELRQAAIAGLVSIGDPQSVATLKQLSQPPHSIPTRMQAIAGLTGFDLKLAADTAAAVLQAAKPQDAPGPMLDSFFTRKEGSDTLAAALHDKKLSVDVAKVALRYMYSVGRSDAQLSEVLSSAAGVATDPPPPTPEEVAQLVNDVIARGDAARGEKVFRRTELSCIRCHSVSRGGGQVGPDLSAVGGSSPVDYIVNSILNPNLAVKEQYVTKVFALMDGMILSGVIVDRDDTRVRIRDAQGKVITIPTADIDEEVEGKSMMPQGLTKFLTRDELLDLTKFVSELGKPGLYEIRKTPSLQRWRWMVKPPVELTQEVPHLEHLRQFVFSESGAEWNGVYSQVAGVLPLSELRPGGQPTVLILQGEVQVNQAGKLQLNVQSTEKLQMWVDTQLFESPSSTTVELEPGRHQITVRVEVSERPEPTLKIDFVRPDDSAIQFEVIGGA